MAADTDTRTAPTPPPPGAATRLPLVVRRFLETEVAGGVVLLVAAVAALVWANSPWKQGYADLWHTVLSIKVGSFGIEEDLRHWVNDALMAVFFFVVGLEIKRELVAGELRTWRMAALPAFAALGGMVVPAALYVALNAGQPGVDGWGIPMATDIAFALGVVALLGSRVPAGVKVFLLTLAIVDDIGAILVIAVFYSGGIEWAPLAGAAAVVGLIVVLRAARVTSMAVYAVCSVVVWWATFESGVHATIAGVVLGLLTPARPMTPAAVVREWAESLADEPSPAESRVMARLAATSVSVTERLEHRLHPITSFVIVPIFALANAGVELEASAVDDSATVRVALGVVVGLVAGKLAGVTAATWLARRLGLGELPAGVTMLHIVGMAGVAGVGFTVSLFIAELAFDAAPLQAAAKIGILAASLAASLLGAALLLVATTRR